MLDDWFIMIQQYPWLPGLALVIGGGGAWVVSRCACRIGLIDRPNERSSHSTPTPKGGGIGILITFILCGVALRLPLLFLVSVSGLSLISLLGDRIDIAPLLRLVAQFIAAFLSLYSLKYHGLLPPFKLWYDPAAFFPLFLVATVFIVGTANFYNFMDGINGIAGLSGIVAFLLLAIYGQAKGVPSQWPALCLCMAMSCIGFLPFNFPHARVFMGDVGSVLLGFLFATLVLINGESFAEVCLLASLLFPFYADELITMVERVREGRSLTKPHRRHLYQILANQAGLAHWKVTTGYGVMQLICGIIFLKASKQGAAFFYATLAIATILFLIANNKIKSLYLNET